MRHQRGIGIEEITSAIGTRDEAETAEHATVLAAVAEALQDAEDDAEALELAITVCDEFMNWADHVKQELRQLKKAGAGVCVSR